MEEKSRRLPGIMPLAMADWLQWDEASEAQVAQKLDLLEAHGEAVLRYSPAVGDAARELLDLVLDHVPDDRLRPDPFLSSKPLEMLCGLVPEDFCILTKEGGEHILSAALLGFPASWSLAEKFGRPLSVIHDPVAPYTDDIARRVQRLFDAVKPDRPLWRANALRYSDPKLFQPRRESERRDYEAAEGFIRSERQSILRLLKTDAVVFSIHTTVIPESALTPEQGAGLQKYPIIHASEDV